MAVINSKIEDVYTLSPLQEGMLFHYLKEPDTSAYITQAVYDVKSKLDSSIIKKAE